MIAYLSLCARCVIFGKSVLMLTGYTVAGCCDGCNNVADLAQCKIGNAVECVTCKATQRAGHLPVLYTFADDGPRMNWHIGEGHVVRAISFEEDLRSLATTPEAKAFAEKLIAAGTVEPPDPED